MRPGMNRRDLLAAIAEQRKAIADAETHLEEARARLDALERDLATTQPEIRGAVTESLRFPMAPVPTTADEKIALFKRLFRGREDVFPRLWENARTGKKAASTNSRGYANASRRVPQEVWFF